MAVFSVPLSEWNVWGAPVLWDRDVTAASDIDWYEAGERRVIAPRRGSENLDSRPFTLLSLSEAVYPYTGELSGVFMGEMAPTIGELSFVASRFPKAFGEITSEHVVSPAYFAMMLRSNRGLCEKHAALAWAIVSTVHGYEWAEGNPADALSIARSAGLCFDDVIPFVMAGIMDIGAVMTARAEGIDVDMMARISGGII